MTDEEKPKRKNEPLNAPCPVCGGTEFEMGHLFDAVYRAGPYKFLSLSTRWEVDIRRCQTCDNLMLLKGQKL